MSTTDVEASKVRLMVRLLQRLRLHPTTVKQLICILSTHVTYLEQSATN